MKHNYNLVKTSILISLFLAAKIIASAQTNPTAQSLPYTQNFTALAASSTIYPAGWQGWNLSASGTSTAFRVVAPIADYALTASSNASINTVGNHNYNGKIGLLSTTTGDASLCLSLNTTGAFNVVVNFDIMTIRNPFVSVTNPRINQVDIQYRVGTAGSFISFSGSSNGVYQNNTVNQTGAVTTPQNSQVKSLTLPAACNNQAVVQIRWVQRDFSGTAGTERPGFAVDNISICPNLATPTISITKLSGICTGVGTTFVASITNGGTTPSYQWKKNGVNGGGNSSTVTLNNLVAGDVISCVLTSNLSCVTSLTATSNQITMGAAGSPPVISGAAITDVSCPGISNGAIDISVSGGTPPYTISWDTVNTQNGPVFGVTAVNKTIANPLFGQGSAVGYAIDGVEGKELFLTRGISYSFSVLASGHPFHISTGKMGAASDSIVVSGQTGAPTQSGTVTFTPNITHPNLLYYPCQFHQWMGWKINLQSGFVTEDLTNLKAGTYTVVVKDANGCTVSDQYVVSELPSTLELSAIISDTKCGAADNGSIDLTVAGGTPPYTINWDINNTQNGSMFGVMVDVKTPSNPYFNMGTSVGFYIDGVEAKELNLVRGIPYAFNVMSPGHPFHISTDFIGASSANIVTSGQTGAPTDNGIVMFTPNATHPPLLYYICANHQYMGYNVNISDGLNVEDPLNLTAGNYTVIVTDANGCTATASYIVNQGSGSPSVLSLVSSTDATCFGEADGTIDLDPTSGAHPFTISGTGPVFSVIAGLKNHSHPQFGTGSANGYIIDGVQGKELTLIRGITYTFSLLVPNHPFFISTSVIGGPANLATEVTDGVTNSMATSGNVTFTPNANHPNLLYYQCGFHNNMGWKINIVDQLPNEDLASCMAGSYSLVATDNLGCVSSPVNVTIAEPSPNTFYYDGDLDTYGRSSESAIACNAPPGFVMDNTDCNDANAAINPGAIEVCNGIDDNCDGTVDFVPLLTLDNSSDAACFGASNGTIDFTASGGTTPYTISISGPVFSVIAGAKNHSHPQFGTGSANGYIIDGVHGKELTLIRGVTYTFSLLVPNHPFFISTSIVGGPGNLASEVTNGVTNSMATSGNLTFTPNASHPSLLYYQCGFHNNMGWKINIVDPLPGGDLANCMSGSYSITAANGSCISDPLNVFIAEPSPNTFYYDGDLDTYGKSSESAIACNAPPGFVMDNTDCNDANAAINPGAIEVCNGIDDNCDGTVDFVPLLTLDNSSDAACFGASNGTIDFTASGGTTPYTISISGPVFSVIAGAKNHSHPQFGTGSANGYIIDGVHGKELTLIRGVTYTFSLLVPNHPFFISTSIVGGPGNLASEVTNGVTNSMATSGNLTFTPNASHPSLLYYQCGFHNNMGWKINIVDPLPGGDLANCMSGSYSITAANGSCISDPLNVFIAEPSPNTFYYDGDLDTYGRSSESAIACNAPPGFVMDNTDCNDANAAINPGANEICNNGIDENCNAVVDDGPGCNVTLELKVYIEGYYLGGGQLVAAIDPVGSPGISDTVIVQLANENAPYNIVYSDTVLLDVNGICNLTYPAGAAGNNYYIVVRHRNAMETWSADAEPFAAVNTYNFTTAQNKAYGNNQTPTSDNSFWAIYSGDISDAGSSSVGIQDGIIESQDYGDMENAVYIVLAGYVTQDITGDGVVESADYSIEENNVAFVIVKMTP